MASVTLAFDILARDKSASRTLSSVGDSADRTGGKLDGLGSKFTGMAKTAGIALGGLAVGAAFFGKQAIDSASNLGESLSKVNVVFAENADEVVKWSQKSATAMGMSQQQALEAAGTFGNFLLAMGAAPTAAQDMSQTMVQLAADLASFNNANPEDVILALRAGLSGEAEPLRKFGVSLSAARVEAEALASGLVKPVKNHTKLTAASIKVKEANEAAAKALKKHGKQSLEYQKAANAVTQAEEALTKATAGSVPEMTAAQKAQASYAIIMQDTALAQGDFSRTSDGLANQQRILAAQFEDVKSKIGQGLLPVALTFVSFLADTAIPMVSEFWSALTSGKSEDEGTLLERIAIGLHDIAVDAKDAISGFVTNALEVLSTWWDTNGDNIIGFFESLGTVLGNIADPVGAWLWETALPSLQTAGEWLIAQEETLPVLLGAVAGGFLAWATNAGLAAIASWAAIAPLLPFIAVGAIAAGVYFLLADRGDGWLDVLIRTGLAVMVAGSLIVGFFETLWRWAKKAYDIATSLFKKIEDIIGLSDRIPLIGGSADTGFGLDDAIKGTIGGVFPWTGLTGDDGGVIPGPRGAPRLVLGHGGETMIPTHKGGSFDAVGEDQLLELRTNNRLLREQNGILLGLAGSGIAGARACAAVMR